MDYNIDEALIESRKWIEAVTGKNFPYDDFKKSLEDGVLLCQLMLKIKPGSIRKINTTSFAGLDNIHQFLRACEGLGLYGSQLFDESDLQDISRVGLLIRDVNKLEEEADRQLKNVCITIFWLGKTAAKLKKYRFPKLNLSAFAQLLSPADLVEDPISPSNSIDSAASPVHSPGSSFDHTDRHFNHVKMEPSYRGNRYSGMYDYNYSRENGYQDDNANKTGDENEVTPQQKQKDDYGKRRYSMPVTYSHPKPQQFIVAAKIEHTRQPSQEKEYTHSRPRKGDYGEPDETFELLGRQKKVVDEDQNSWMSSLSSWKTKRIKATSTARERKAELEQTEQEESRSRGGNKTFAQMLEDREHRERTIAAIVNKEEDETREELNKILTEVPLEYNSDSEHGSQKNLPVTHEPEPEEPKRGYYSSSLYGRTPRYAPETAKRYVPERSAPSVTVSQPKRAPPVVAPRRFQRREPSPVENRPALNRSLGTTKPVIIKSFEAPTQSQPPERSAQVRRPVESRYSDQSTEEKPAERRPYESRYSEPPSYSRKSAEEPRQPTQWREPPEEPRQQDVARKPADVDVNSLKTAEKRRVSSGIKDRLAALSSSQQPKEESRRLEAFNEMTICINQRPNNERGFGFSISGGTDEDRPVVVEKVVLGGSADICELCTGDEIISINHHPVANLSHDAAVKAIGRAVVTGNLQLKIRRYGERDSEDSQSYRMKIQMPPVEEAKQPIESVSPREREQRRVESPTRPVAATRTHQVEVAPPRVETQPQHIPDPVRTEERPEPVKRVEQQYQYSPIGAEDVKVDAPKPVAASRHPVTAPIPVEEKIQPSKTVETESEKPVEVAPKKDDRIRFVSRPISKPKFEVKPLTFDITKSPPRKPEPLKGGDSVGELSPSEEERLEREIMEQLEKEEEEARRQEEMHKKIEEDEHHHRKESEADDEPPPLPSQPPPNMIGKAPKRERGREVVKREIWKRRNDFFRKPADLSCMPVFAFPADEEDKENVDKPVVVTETKGVNDDVEALWKQVEKMPAKKAEDKQQEKVSELFADLPPLQTPTKRFDIEEERRKLEKWQEAQDEHRRQKYLTERKRLQDKYLKDLERIHEEMVRNREMEREKLLQYEEELFRHESGPRAQQEAQWRRAEFEREQQRREDEYQLRKADLMAVYEKDQQRLAEEEHFETQEDKLKHEENAWTLEKDREEDKKQEIEVKKKHIERKRRRTQELDVEKIRLEAEAQLKKEWEELEKEKARQQEREKLAQEKLETIRREQDMLGRQRRELEKIQEEERRQLEAERSKLHRGPAPLAVNLMPRETYSKFAALNRESNKNEPSKHSPQTKPQKSLLKKSKAEEKVEPEIRKPVVPQTNLANKNAYNQFAAIPHGEDEVFHPQPQELPPPTKQSYILESHPTVPSPKPSTSPNVMAAEQPVKKERPFLTQAQYEPAYNKYYQQPPKELPERDVDYHRVAPEKPPHTQAPVPQQRGRKEAPGEKRVPPERDFAPKHSLMSKYRDETAPSGQHWLVEEAERRRRAEREGYDRGSPYEITPPRKTSPMPAEKPQRDVPPPTEMRYDERYMYAPPERDTAQRQAYENQTRMRPQQRETKAERQQKLQKRRTVHEMEPDNRAKEWTDIERRQRSLDDSERRPQSLQGPYSNSAENLLQHGAKKNKGPLPDSVIQNLTNRTGNKHPRSQPPLASPQRYPYPSQPPTAAVPPAPAPGKQPGNRSVSGKVLCTRCGKHLGKGAAMIIESLGLHFHMQCFKCCVCNVQLGNGAKGTDVRIRASRLHCQNCYSNDAGYQI